MKKVSIITPCYNASDYIEETYGHLKNQTHSNWEWVVVDDCSTDNSKQILNKIAQSDSRLKVFSNNVNSGAAVTRNNSLDHATGDYVAFLDSDDIWSPEKLELQLKFATENNIDFTYHNYLLVDSNGSKIKDQLVPLSIKQRDLYKFNPFATSSIMIKRDVLESNKIRFRNHLRKRQDYFFWFDALAVSNKAQALEQRLSSYRLVGADSLSANKKRMAIIQWQLLKSEFKLGLTRRTYYFIQYAIHGIKKYFL